MSPPPIPGVRARIRDQRSLWFGVIGGPAAWGAHLGFNYLFVPTACAAGTSALLHGVTLVTVVIAVAAIVSAWRVRSSARSREDAVVAERSRFAGNVGVALSALFLLVILLEGIPPLLIDPCL